MKLKNFAHIDKKPILLNRWVVDLGARRIGDGSD